MRKFLIKTNYKSEVINITESIKEEVIKSGIKQGIVNIFCAHSTAGLVIFENSDASLKRDLLGMLEEIVPNKKYAHSNAKAHLKASFLKTDITLIVENANIILGKWQGIYLVDFEGGRERKIYIKVIGD